MLGNGLFEQDNQVHQLRDGLVRESQAWVATSSSMLQHEQALAANPIFNPKNPR